MTNSRQRITTLAAPPGQPGRVCASLLRRSPLLLLAAALVAVAVFLTPGAQPAQAQTPVELVKNTGQVAATPFQDWSKAFGVIIFTGSANTGKTYTLTKIYVPTDIDGGEISDASKFRAELWTGTNDTFVPGAKLHDLTITPVQGGVDLVAPQGTTLSGNTRYALVVYRLSGETATWNYAQTAHSAQTSSIGWRIGDNRKATDTPPTSTSVWGDPADIPQGSNPIRIPQISVHGYEGLPPTGTLTGLTISGTTTRDGQTHTFDLFSIPRFDRDTGNYTIRVPEDLKTITFTPTWGGNVRDFELRMRPDTTKSIDDTTKARGSTASGLPVTARVTTDNPHPAIRINLRNGNSFVHYFDLEFVSGALSFGGATIQDELLTVGVGIKRLLPEATGGFGKITYSAMGLPEGLTLSEDRYIRGTPEAATQTPADVTYTATDTVGGSDSLTFQVTVNPPVTFDEEDLDTYYGRIITYTAGQPDPLTVTLPEASGGTGTLTYELVFGGSVRMAAAGDPGAGVNLDPSTRVLTIDGNSNDNRIALRDTGYAVSYVARDENGAKAIASSSISVIGPPTLPEIADKTWTVGQAVSITLPAAAGPWWKLVPEVRYQLGPTRTVEFLRDGEVSRTVEVLDMEGMSFNPQTRLLSGTPQFASTTNMTYTATDGNGVTTTETFTITMVNGPSVPTAAPSNVQAAQQNDSMIFVQWDTVTGATAYVVQVIQDGGSFPTKPVDSVPDDVHLGYYPGRGLVSISEIATGDYKVRVAARNADGVGPWATELSFTVQPGGM